MSNPGAPSSASAVAADAAAAAATAPSHLVAAPSGYGNRPRVLDKVCIVTGATGGIGAATVLRFAEEGARGIVISDLSQSACEAYAASLSVNIPPAIGASGKVEYIALAADVTDEKQVAALFDQALQKWGHVDVVFANVSARGAVDETKGRKHEELILNFPLRLLPPPNAGRSRRRDGSHRGRARRSDGKDAQSQHGRE